MLADFHSVPLVIVLETHNVIFAQIIAELNFDDRQYACTAVTDAVISERWDMDVLAFTKPQFVISANNVGHAMDYDPVFAPPRVALKAESGARLYF